MRIHITGNAGSGKSTLAKRLGSKLGIEVYGLDKVVWQEHWIETPPDDRKRKEQELCQKESWIIEGVSSSARESADVIIFLDFTRRSCYLRCIKRNWRYLFKSRPELPDNCPEIRVLSKLVKIIWKFQNLARPKILAECLEKNRVLIKLGNDLEVEDFFKQAGHNMALHRTALRYASDDQ